VLEKNLGKISEGIRILNQALKPAVFACMFLLILIAPAAELSGVNADNSSTTYLYSENAQTTSSLPLGWGGYITTISYANKIMDTLHSEGRTAIRYWCRPQWYYGASPQNFNKAIADALVSKAITYNMQVLIEPEHNWPAPNDDILDNHWQEWERDVLTIANYYKSYTDTVILEPSCEFGNADQISHYSHLCSTLRAAGIHNKIIFDLWWNIPVSVISDPDNNYGVARHLYLSNCDYLSDESSDILDEIKVSHVVDGVTVNLQGLIDTYFYGSNDMYVQKAKQLNIPLGFWIDGSGPAVDEAYLNNPTNVGIAYVMLLIREAIANNVPVITYRIGDSAEENKHDLYQSKALTYFGESYFPSGTSDPTATRSDLSGDLKVDANDIVFFVDGYNSYWEKGIILNMYKACDFNSDGKINFEDITLFVAGYIAYWGNQQ
jgi:hypothetical protein